MAEFNLKDSGLHFTVAHRRTTTCFTKGQFRYTNENTCNHICVYHAECWTIYLGSRNRKDLEWGYLHLHAKNDVLSEILFQGFLLYCLFWIFTEPS